MWRGDGRLILIAGLGDELAGRFEQPWAGALRPIITLGIYHLV
jgi:hypothetical protein